MNSLGMTPLVPIFRANLPEEWNLFLDIYFDGDTAHDLLSNSSVATALTMTSHKVNRVGYIPGHFPVGEKHVARNLTRTIGWNPFFQSGNCKSKG